MPYEAGEFSVPFSAITQQKIIDTDVKLSIHRSGFVQFSGRGVISGIDKTTTIRLVEDFHLIDC